MSGTLQYIYTVDELAMIGTQVRRLLWLRVFLLGKILVLLCMRMLMRCFMIIKNTRMMWRVHAATDRSAFGLKAVSILSPPRVCR